MAHIKTSRKNQSVNTSTNNKSGGTAVLAPPAVQFKEKKEGEKEQAAPESKLLAPEMFAPIDPPSPPAANNPPPFTGTKTPTVQKKSSSSQQVAPFQLKAKKSSGNAIPNDVRGKMENAFKADFSNVKVETNSSSAKEMGALAYAKGEELHFASGQFNPSTQSGQELIGHELAHVVQQRAGRVKPTKNAGGVAINDDVSLEREADNMGRKAAAMKTPQMATPQVAAAPVQGKGIVQGFFGKIWKGAKAVGSGIASGARAVGNGVVSGARAVGRGARAVGRGAVRGARAVGRGARAVGNGVVSGARAVGRGARAVGNGVVNGARALGRGARNVGSRLWDGAKSVGSKVGRGIQKAGQWANVGLQSGKLLGRLAWDGIKGGAKSLGRSALNSAKRLGSGLWNGAKSVGSGLWNGAKSVGSGLLGGAKSIGSGLWNGAKSVGSGLWGGAKSIGSGLWNGAKSIGGGLWNGAKSVGNGLWNSAKSVGGGLWNGAKSVGGGLWNSAKSVGGGLWNGAKSVGGGLWNGAKSIASGDILGGLGSIGSGLWGGAKSVGSGLLGGAKSVGSGLWGGAKSVGSGLLGGAKSIGSGLWGGAKSVGSGLLGGAKSIGSGLWGGAKSIGSGLWGGAKSIGSGLWGGAKSIGSGLWNGAKDVGSGLWNGARDVGSAVAGEGRRLWNGARNAYNGVRDFVGDVRENGFASTVEDRALGAIYGEDRASGPQGREADLDELSEEYGIDEFMTDAAYFGPGEDREGLNDSERERLTALGYDPETFQVVEGENGLQMVHVLPGEGSDLDPYLSMRGSEADEDLANDWGTDFDYQEVGRTQYDSNEEMINALMDSLTEQSGSGRIQVSGHSLGGALAQRLTAERPEDVSRLTGFQNPGISEETYNTYMQNVAGLEDGVAPPEIAYHYSQNDIVHLAGERNLPGTHYVHDSARWSDSSTPIPHTETLVDTQGEQSPTPGHGVTEYNQFPFPHAREFAEGNRKEYGGYLQNILGALDSALYQ